MKLICYPTPGELPKIIPAPTERAWMDATPQGFAYRCLPMNIANAHGWMILNPTPFAAIWDGGAGREAIKIQPMAGGAAALALSHFGAGVLTFNVHALFRTEPGYDLVVTGPVNAPKDAIAPLTGIVETDWSVSTFTMNWKFTRKNTAVRFDRDEPFCMIYPVPRGIVEQTEPVMAEMTGDVKAQYEGWAESRRTFNEALAVPGSEAQRQKWQKDYFQGAGPAPADHRTKVKGREFK